jgi:hypothetical protein
MSESQQPPDQNQQPLSLLEQLARCAARIEDFRCSRDAIFQGQFPVRPYLQSVELVAILDGVNEDRVSLPVPRLAELIYSLAEYVDAAQIPAELQKQAIQTLAETLRLSTSLYLISESTKMDQSNIQLTEIPGPNQHSIS